MARNNNKSSCSSGCCCCLLKNGSTKISKLKINIEPKMKSCKNVFLKSSSREKESGRGRRVEGVVPIETGSHATKSLVRSSDFAQGPQEVCARGSPSLLRVKARTTCVSYIALSLSLSPSACNK